MEKRNIIHKIFLLTAAAVILIHGAVYSSPYELSAGAESILAGTGAALLGVSLYTGKKVDALTDQEISSLSKSGINRFDRSAADNWSPAAGKWSYGVLVPVMASPLAFLAEDKTRSDFLTIGVMYAESLLITQGLNGTVKNIVQRNRPFTYNPDAPYAEKREKDAVLSFYSGHTVNGFNSAVFVSTVFSDYYPGSKWRYAVWGSTLSAASLTGYLRYRAGKHFPSDILTGALIGSATGYLIPALHRTGNNSISFQIITGAENSFAVALNF